MEPTPNSLLTRGLCRNPECPSTFGWPWSRLGLQAPLLAGGSHFVSFSSNASYRGVSAFPRVGLLRVRSSRSCFRQTTGSNFRCNAKQTTWDGPTQQLSWRLSPAHEVTACNSHDPGEPS